LTTEQDGSFPSVIPSPGVVAIAEGMFITVQDPIQVRPEIAIFFYRRSDRKRLVVQMVVIGRLLPGGKIDFFKLGQGSASKQKRSFIDFPHPEKGIGTRAVLCPFEFAAHFDEALLGGLQQLLYPIAERVRRFAGTRQRKGRGARLWHRRRCGRHLGGRGRCRAGRRRGCCGCGRRRRRLPMALAKQESGSTGNAYRQASADSNSEDLTDRSFAPGWRRRILWFFRSDHRVVAKSRMVCLRHIGARSSRVANSCRCHGQCQLRKADLSKFGDAHSPSPHKDSGSD
jgi:hypothetical protein